MNPVIMIGGVFIVVIIIAMMIMLMKSGGSQHKRTMSVIRGNMGADAGTAKGGKDDQSKRRAEIARKLKEQQADDGKRRKSTMAQQLEQAGIAMKVPQFLLTFLAISVVVVLVLSVVMKHSLIVSILAGVIFFFGGQRFWIRRKTKKRQKKFLMEFADALEAMVRLLKAGMPVSEAIKMSAHEFAGPVGDEMSRMYDAQKIGVPLAEAAMEAARRMPLTEMQMFATGISIQAQTGASLSDVLMNLAGVIRARFKLKRKIVALSSEAKSSAMIIGALPLVVGGGMYFINPAFIEPLITTFTGKILLCFCAVWMFAGCMVMKIMINFKI